MIIPHRQFLATISPRASWVSSPRCRRLEWVWVAAFFAGSIFFAPPIRAEGTAPSLFTGDTDIGAPEQAGDLVYDAAAGAYTVTGGGANMWFKSDSFHFVWKKTDDDTALSADIAFVGQSQEPHRKAVLMIRQSLDADSSYVDAAVHGDGLTSLQFREMAGDVTHEIQTTVRTPRRMRLEKIGDDVYLLLAGPEGVLQPSGCSIRLPFKTPFYVGIGVCAHQPGAVEKVVFSNVQFSAPTREGAAVRSVIETISIASGDRQRVYHGEQRVAAPNWSHDGAALVFNENGKLFRFSLAKGSAAEPVLVNTEFANKCTDNHGFSPDGTRLAITDKNKTLQSRIYVLPATGGAPKEITARAPSEFHGWSPDGRFLIFSGGREGRPGIFSVPVDGGPEVRLTTAEGRDDGPEYSADGQWIYFSSDRGGRSKIWRMHADGTAPEAVTNDELVDRCPHPSPDGKWIAYLSYPASSRNPAIEQEVMLRLLSTTSGESKTLAKFFGGDGTLASPSWSPDSLRLAYVRYQPKQ